jgi:F-type H+-transporting ATPase subunit delta
MKGLRVASRYAKSLMSLAIEQKQLDAVYADMNTISTTCANSRDLQLLLKSPIIKSDKKKSIIAKIFADKLNKISQAFVNIIITHRREDILFEIAQNFVEQYKRYNHITTAQVTSAVELDQAIIRKISAIVQKQSAGKQVEIKQTVNPEIIGGIIVRVDDKQYDGSISRKLNELKKTFSKNTYQSQL